MSERDDRRDATAPAVTAVSGAESPGPGAESPAPGAESAVSGAPHGPGLARTRPVAVVGGTRIPFARSDGPYATASNQEMLTATVDGLAERYGLDEPGAVGELVAGAVLKHSRDFNLARETVLGSKLDARTPAYDIQQACGTGLQ
ncbi:hypothetical protein ACFVJ9_56275, partial [Streptomyces sp. NPDC127574]